MSIKYVILGFLSEAPLTGYDLKKKFSASDIFHWSGNNNQIYKALVELHNEGLVTVEVQHQDSKPPRKLYTLTDVGLAALRAWVGAVPELPQFQNPLLMQLTWAEQLAPDELREMLTQYESNLRIHIAMLREKAHRSSKMQPSRSFVQRTMEHWISLYELELNWVQSLLHELKEG